MVETQRTGKQSKITVNRATHQRTSCSCPTKVTVRRVLLSLLYVSYRSLQRLCSSDWLKAHVCRKHGRFRLRKKNAGGVLRGCTGDRKNFLRGNKVKLGKAKVLFRKNFFAWLRDRICFAREWGNAPILLYRGTLFAQQQDLEVLRGK